MHQARHDHGIVDRGRDRVVEAGDHGRGDRALVARQHRADALVDRPADAVEEARIGEPGATLLRRRERLDRAGRKAGRADTLGT
jgi:hypothetical protein